MHLSPSPHFTTTTSRRRLFRMLACLALLAGLLAPTAQAQQDLRRSDPPDIEKVNDSVQFAVATSSHGGTQVIFEAPSGAASTFSAGPASCEFDCIERAWLSSALSTTAMTLDVELNVDATISYQVGAHAPFLGTDGVPYFPAPVAADDTAVPTASWTTSVTGLDAATTYHVIVIASDDGGTHAVTGTFTTVTPAGEGLVFEADHDGGCSIDCITSIEITPGTGVNYDESTIHVETLVPVSLQVSYQAVEMVGSNAVGGPIDANASGQANDLSWSTTVDELQPETSYSVMVIAVDEHARAHTEVVTTATAPMAASHYDVLYAPLRTKVYESGDTVGAGELRFRWAVGDPENPLHIVNRDRKKIDDGESFYFPVNNQYTVQNVAAGAMLPDFIITGFELDTGLVPAFSSSPPGSLVDPHAGWSGDEGRNTAQLHQWLWNEFFGAVTVAEIDDLARCSDFELISDPTKPSWDFADEACIEITTHPAGAPNGEKYAHFTTVIAVMATAS